MTQNKKKLNKTEYLILNKVLKEKDISRTVLSKDLKLTPAAITKIIKKLIKYELLIEDKLIQSTGGRPRKVLVINKEYKKIIGINLGVGFISVSISYLNGEIIFEKERKFSFKSNTKLLTLLNEEIDEILIKFNVADIVGIGLATHGLIDRKKGNVIFSPHFRWHNLDVKKILEEKYKIPVVVENDVRAMTVAEILYGCAKDMKDFMFIYLRNGIGGAFYLDGKIFEGSNSGSGEIGHFIVNENSTKKCRCGKYGCLETEYSKDEIVNKVIWKLEELGKYNNKGITIDQICIKANAKEEPYYSIIQEVAYEIGKVIGNVLNVIDINNVIISGDLVILTEKLFLENIRKGIQKNRMEDFEKMVRIYPSQLKDMIGSYGALSLIISNLFEGKQFFKLG